MIKVVRVMTLVAVVVLAACGGRSAEDQVVQVPPSDTRSATPSASVTVDSPADGATVASPVKVKMAATGVSIEPASAGVTPNSGHFHIIVDADCVASGQVIPADATHLHFGMAQTEADVPLPSGPHKLCIQVADAAHMATDITKIVPFTVSSS